MEKLLSKFKIVVIMLCVALLLASCSFGKNGIHGEELLKLTDSELYETVYFQTLDLAESYPDEETALSQMSPEVRTVYVLSVFDMELQCGGLCQFLVNSSGEFAAYVDESLETVNATEHKKLLTDFLAENNIDITNLESFKCDSTDDYIEQTERYDYDSFDDDFYELTPLQDYILSYIKANISEF